jgi:hypothetical protein
MDRGAREEVPCGYAGTEDHRNTSWNEAMNPLTDNHMATTYEQLVDRWTLDAVASGVEGFWQLVDSLPGVYPSVTLEAVRRLSAHGQVPQTLLASTPPRSVSGKQRPATNGNKSLPPQHPLAYDWRFSDSTGVKLMDLALELTKQSKTVALLGTPTLYLLAAQRGFPGRFLLVDRNPSLKAFLPQSPPRGVLETRDIMNGVPVQGSFQVVVADPPWYEDETKGFLWLASRMCELNGHVLLSFPPIGTRPGISGEWRRLLGWIASLGLELVGVEESGLTYLTPPFEHNAMRAEGFQYVPPAWRKGNLVVLSRRAESAEERPEPRSANQAWREFRIGDVSVWVRQGSSTQFQDPTLLSLVPGDILPTVSRRDNRRKDVQVWTSGNRVFACQGRNVLAAILQALEVGDMTQTVVARAIGR